MLNTIHSASSQICEDRETRIQALIEQLRAKGESVLRQMAERLVDLPEDKSFGQIEYDLRDLGHQLACDCHETGLKAGKKRATSVPARSARTAKATPASLATATRRG
jgi:hypothetical protein